jgi:hypothetical protein
MARIKNPKNNSALKDTNPAANAGGVPKYKRK